MKKFFSLLCAVLVVLSASAISVQPVRKLTRADKMEAHKAYQQKKQLKQREAVTIAFDQTKKAPARAHKARLEATDVTIVKAVCSAYDGLISYSLIDENDNYFEFSILVDAGAKDVELGKTYTIDDLDLDGSYLFTPDLDFFDYSEVAFTKTQEEDGTVRIEVALKTIEGTEEEPVEVEYALHYVKAPVVLTGDTVFINIEKTILEPTYYSNYGDWYVTGGNDEYAITLDFYGDENSILGSYETADFDLDYTAITLVETEEDLEIEEVKLEVTAAYENRLDFKASIICADGIVYDITMFYKQPIKEAEDAIVSEELTISKEAYLFWEYYVFTAFTDTKAIQFTLMEDNYLGTWDVQKDLSGQVLAEDGDVYYLYSGEITIASTDGAIAVTGKVLCYNNIEYTLDLKYIKPVASKEQALKIDNTQLRLLTGGGWQVLGESEDGADFITLATFENFEARTFTTDDFEADYTFVELIVDGDTISYALVDVEAQVTMAEVPVNDPAVALFSGFLVGQNIENSEDVIKFTFDFAAEVPEQGQEGNEYDADEEDFLINFDSYEIDTQYLETYGEIDIVAQNEDNSYISLAFFLPDGDLAPAPGEYPVSEEEATNTVLAGSVDQYIYGSFAGYLTDDGYINVPLWLIVSGKVIVAESGVIEVQAVNTWGRAINCRLGKNSEAIDNTEVNASAVKTLRNGQLVIIKNGNEFNALGTVIK